MAGRTPEYLGKKLETREITLVVIATLVPALTIVVPTAVALLAGISAPGNGGPRRFSEILYAFTSVLANNGSALSVTIGTDAYDARKARNAAPSSGTLQTGSPLFGALVVATAIVVTALTFIPADALGPVAEELLPRDGRSF